MAALPAANSRAAGRPSAVPRDRVADALYEWCRTNQAVGHVFNQEDLLSAGVIPNRDLKVLVSSAQNLVNRNLFKIHEIKNSGGQLGWELVSEERAASYGGLDRNERMVYSIIDSAGARGIWTKTIKNRLAAHAKVLERIYKTLEAKALIKPMKSVQYPQRKMYIISSLQPSEEATGGAWYTDGQLDAELMITVAGAIELRVSEQSWFEVGQHEHNAAAEPINGKRKTTHDGFDVNDKGKAKAARLDDNQPRSLSPEPHNHKAKKHGSSADKVYLPHEPGYQGYPTLHQITRMVTSSGVTRGASIPVNAIKDLLEVMVYDDRLYKMRRPIHTDETPDEAGGDTITTYRSFKTPAACRAQMRLEFQATTMEKPGQSKAARRHLELEDIGRGGTSELPCLQCPAFDLCGDGGPVNVDTCVYFDEWFVKTAIADQLAGDSWENGEAFIKEGQATKSRREAALDRPSAPVNKKEAPVPLKLEVAKTRYNLLAAHHPRGSLCASTVRATPQGGVFEGLNPTVYDPKNPLILFVIQAVLVIFLTRLIHFPLAYLRQPRVIAEVITGIILGPSVCGRIPGFTKTIFPTASMPAFTLAANLGLVLFLFLVGLEVDLRHVMRNWRIAVSVAAAGMALPFGLGAGIAYGLYHQFRDDKGIAPIGFGVYLLFIGVAMAITAFPVLCRILTSLKLLGTPVGLIVLSAGIGNDIVGWILLALCVALVNSGAGLTALWILLVVLGYALFLCFLLRPTFIWVLRKTGSLANGPSQGVVALTLLLMLASAFFTQIIGIHAIFGAFMIGIICPHEGGFAIKLTEKIEDLMSVLLLPLYFTTSGLNTNIGLLNNGITWAYVVGVTAIAFFGKLIGTTLAARLNGLVWRESLTIGALMSCKGVVELIVLNIGYQAKILSTTTFTIFVVMTLLTTFATTPLTAWLYPPWKNEVARKVLVYLRLDSLSSILTMVSLLASERETDQPHAPELQSDMPNMRRNSKALALSPIQHHRPVRFHGLRLMELTERESSVMKVSQLADYANRDAVIRAFGTFGQSRDIPIGGQIAIVPQRSFSGTLLQRARDLRSDFVLLPWSETGTMSEHASLFDEKTGNPLSNREFTKLVSETYDKLHGFAHVGVFIDSGVFETQTQLDSGGPERPTLMLQRSNPGLSVSSSENVQAVVEFKLPGSGRQRIVAVYQHGHDDLHGVQLALQLARHSTVDLKIIKATGGDDEESSDDDHHDLDFKIATATITEEMRRRVKIEEAKSTALEAVIAAVNEPSTAQKLVIIGRGSIGASSGTVTLSSSDSRVFGPWATAVLQTVREKGLKTSMMVVQARRDPHDLAYKNPIQGTEE
ncbi:hypothetical protein DV736_g6419, partial [Chaetothyriales sp. CBS 134916]